MGRSQSESVAIDSDYQYLAATVITKEQETEDCESIIAVW